MIWSKNFDFNWSIKISKVQKLNEKTKKNNLEMNFQTTTSLVWSSAVQITAASIQKLWISYRANRLPQPSILHDKRSQTRYQWIYHNCEEFSSIFFPLLVKVNKKWTKFLVSGIWRSNRQNRWVYAAGEMANQRGERRRIHITKWIRRRRKRLDWNLQSKKNFPTQKFVNEGDEWKKNIKLIDCFI